MDIRKETLLAICRSKQTLFQPGPASPGVHLLCVPWPGPASLSPRHANALEGNQLLNSFPIPNAKSFLRLHSRRSINRNMRSIYYRFISGSRLQLTPPLPPPPPIPLSNAKQLQLSGQGESSSSLPSYLRCSLTRSTCAFLGVR